MPFSSQACTDPLSENTALHTAPETPGERPLTRATPHSSAKRPLRVGAPVVPIHIFWARPFILFHWSRFRRRPRLSREAGKRACGHRIDGLVKALADRKVIRSLGVEASGSHDRCSLLARHGQVSF